MLSPTSIVAINPSFLIWRFCVYSVCKIVSSECKNLVQNLISSLENKSLSTEGLSGSYSQIYMANQTPNITYDRDQSFVLCVLMRSRRDLFASLREGRCPAVTPKATAATSIKSE